MSSISNVTRLFEKAGRFVLIGLLGSLVGCAHGGVGPAPAEPSAASNFEYRIAPGDILDIYVWNNPGVSAQHVTVRPDGRISSPLIENLEAAGKTPAELGKEIAQQLSSYIKEPLVTVSVANIVGGFNEQIRVIGEATKPMAIPYRTGMSILDVMIDVGGLTQYAAGDRAKLIRTVNGKRTEIPVRLDDLIKDGDVSANVPVAPGDILLIPESYF